MEWCDPKTIGLLLFLIVLLGGIALVTFVLFAHSRISSIFISRSSAEICTNDLMIWSEIRNTVDGIDASTNQLIWRATAGRMILDYDKYDMVAETMCVNLLANQPLLNASYANHHTRVLDTGGAGGYIADMLSIPAAARRHESDAAVGERTRIKIVVETVGQFAQICSVGVDGVDVETFTIR